MLYKGLSKSCLDFIVLLYSVSGWTVPLNHILLIPAEHNLSLHPPDAGRLVKMFCCWTLWTSLLLTWVLCWAVSASSVFCCCCFLSLAFSLTVSLNLISVSERTSWCLPLAPFISFSGTPSSSACPPLLLPLPASIIKTSITGPVCCCHPDAAAATSVATLLGFILTHVHLSVL